MSFYKYCPKCGNIISIDSVTNCNFCNEPYIVTDYEWILNDGGRGVTKRKEIFEKYVKPNPLFDEELYNKRVALDKRQEEATSNRLRMEKQQAQKANVPRCPTCGSTNVHPIPAGKKAVGFALVGLFSSNLGKSYECENCKYKW